MAPEVNPIAYELLRLSDQDIKDVLRQTEDNMESAEDIS